VLTSNVWSLLRLLVGLYEPLPATTSSGAVRRFEQTLRASAERWIGSELFRALPAVCKALCVLYPFLTADGSDSRNRELQSESVLRLQKRVRYIYGCWRWYNLHHTMGEAPPLSAANSEQNQSKQKQQPSASASAAPSVAALRVELSQRYLTPLHNALFLSATLFLATTLPHVPLSALPTHCAVVCDVLCNLEFCRIEFSAYRELFGKLMHYARAGVLELPSSASTAASTSASASSKQQSAATASDEKQTKKEAEKSESESTKNVQEKDKKTEADTSASASAVSSSTTTSALQNAQAFVHTFASAYLFPELPPASTPTLKLSDLCFPPHLRARYAQRPFVCSFLAPTIACTPLPSADSASASASAPPLEAALWRRKGLDVVEVARHYLVMSIVQNCWQQLPVLFGSMDSFRPALIFLLVCV
jgi:hypothetical protein